MARQFYYPWKGQGDGPSLERNQTALEEFLNSLLLPDGQISDADHVSGSGPPGSELGKDGDVYFDTANSDIWLKGPAGWELMLDTMDQDQVQTLVDERLRWRNEWSQQTYEKNDVVRDGAYTMVANKDTDDRAAPVPISSVTWLLPDNPTWTPQTYTGRVFTGVRVTPPEGRFFQLSAYRLWIPDISEDAHYQIANFDLTTGIFNIRAAFDGTITEIPGWVTVPVDPQFVGDNDDFVLVMSAHNVSTYTDTVLDYNYIGSSNQGNDPGAGNVERNNQQDQLRMSNTDDNGGDQTAMLDTIIPGSLVLLENAGGTFLYEVTGYQSSAAAWRSFNVTLTDTTVGGPSDGAVTMTVRVPVALPTEYVEVPLHWDPYPALQGYYSEDTIDGGTYDNTAYGVDIEIQEFTSSDDWDLMAWAGNADGGGDDSNPSTLQQLEAWPTGPTFQNGVFSIAGTVLTIPAGRGVVMDSYTDPEDIPSITSLAWDEQTIDFGSVTTRHISYVYIDNSGLAQFDPTAPSPALFRQRLYLGRTFHNLNDGSLTAFRPWHAVPNQTSQTLLDLISATGGAFISSGADIDPNTNLTYDTTETQWFSPGESWQNDRDDPNFANNPGSTPQAFSYIYSDGSFAPAPQTNVDPGSYESSPGIITAIPGSGRRCSIQRCYVSIGNLWMMAYGQEWYSNLEEAVNNLAGDIQRFQPSPYVEDEAQIQLIGYFIMEAAATDLADGTDVIIINDKRLPIGGGGGTSHTHDATYLQLAGGTMAGDINMDGFDVYNLENPPPQLTSAVSLDYLNGLDFTTIAEGDTQWLRIDGLYPMQGDIDMDGNDVVGIKQLVGYEGVFTVRPAAGYNLDFKGGDNQVRFRVNDSGDLQFRALDGLTTTFLWDESQGRWEFETPLSMSDNPITDLTDPTDAQDAATKQYVDNSSPTNVDHNDLLNVTASQHHARYTDAEAVAAVGDFGAGLYLPLAGGTLTGRLTVNLGVLPSTAGSVLHPLVAQTSDGNVEAVVVTSRRFGEGFDHNSQHNLITRQVDATWGGGLALGPSGFATLYFQWTTVGPYEPVNWVYVTSAGVQTKGILELQTNVINMYGADRPIIRMRKGGVGAGWALASEDTGKFALYDYSHSNYTYEVNPGGVGMHFIAQNPDSSVARNITIATIGPSAGIDGDVWLQWA